MLRVLLPLLLAPGAAALLDEASGVLGAAALADGEDRDKDRASGVLGAARAETLTAGQVRVRSASVLQAALCDIVREGTQIIARDELSESTPVGKEEALDTENPLVSSLSEAWRSVVGGSSFGDLQKVATQVAPVAAMALVVMQERQREKKAEEELLGAFEDTEQQVEEMKQRLLEYGTFLKDTKAELNNGEVQTMRAEKERAKEDKEMAELLLDVANKDEQLSTMQGAIAAKTAELKSLKATRDEAQRDEEEEGPEADDPAARRLRARAKRAKGKSAVDEALKASARLMFGFPVQESMQDKELLTDVIDCVGEGAPAERPAGPLEIL